MTCLRRDFLPKVVCVLRDCLCGERVIQEQKLDISIEKCNNLEL